MVCLGLVQSTTCEAVHGGQANYVPDLILGMGDTLVTKLVKHLWPQTSLMVQWMSLPANAGDMGSTPGLGRFHMHGAATPMLHNY